MQTLEELKAELELKTPDEIAALLRKEGIKGRVADACDCPIARFLRLKTGEPVSVYDLWSNLTGPYKSVLAPLSAKRFAQKFDRGFYPDLVEA